VADPTTMWFTAAFVAVSFVIVDTIPDLVLRPYVSGRNLHVGAVMIAYTLGPLLFGWYGIFLGPIILVLVINFARHVLPVLIAREPLVPYAVDPGVAAPDDSVLPVRRPDTDPVNRADATGAERQDDAAERSKGSESAGEHRGTEADGGTEPYDDTGGFEFGVDRF